MNLDSANFDPKRYVLTMLKQNTIKELIRKNNQIDEEIKVHDHEIQSLVFQNYSKFISSIDTVRKMKDNICMVDDKLQVLDSSMDKISDLALKIDETFKFKRKQIQKLDTVNRDLQKLRNLCDFPNVLKQDLAEYKSIQENKICESFAQGPKLFHKSIAVYQQCFKTLQDLKSQSLIEPIYKESKAKIEEVRSILRSRQVQFSKENPSSTALRAITKNLIIISDEQNQVSALRSYFHSWKERLMLKKITNVNNVNNKGMMVASGVGSQGENPKYDRTVSFIELLNDGKIGQPCEQFWQDFLMEFEFLYDQLYNKLILTDEILLLVNNYCKDVFNWAILNQLEEIPHNCSSFKVYVHLNHTVSTNLHNALKKIQPKDKIISATQSPRTKIFTELSLKLQDKIENVGNVMINFIFGRLKLAIMEQICESKKNSATVTISEQLLKETYIKILGPIKETFKNNFQPLLNDLEHLNSSYEKIYSSRDKYENAIHEQIDSFIRFLGTITSLPPDQLTEEIFQQINPTPKLSKMQRNYIEGIIKEFIEIQENGLWYAVAHNYLNYLCNQLGKKIIESAHKRIEISQNHVYVGVFNSIKHRIGNNLMNLVKFYTNKIIQKPTQSQIFIHIRQFIEVVNSIFPDTRRGILKKPSFLTEEGGFIHETELLSAKKLKIIEKQIIVERSHILTIFIRRLLKLVLIFLRNKKEGVEKEKEEEDYLNTRDLYCLVQICYEIGNVQEESQISAFYHLLKKNSGKGKEEKNKTSQEQLLSSYMEIRKTYIEATPTPQ